jgi:hypothetical protein
MTVHNQRVSGRRRLVGANNFSRLLFFGFDLWLLHIGSQIMLQLNRNAISSVV